MAEKDVSILDKLGVDVGFKTTYERTITEKDINLFAEVSGDYNPVHMNEEFARKTFFKGRIAHGVIAVSLLSAAMAKLPGLVILLTHSSRFMGPVRIGDEITALAEQRGIDTTAIQQRLAQSTANRLEILSRVYDKAPESARQGIENAIENSVKKYQRALDKLKEKNATGNVTDEETVMNRIQNKIRERLQINASNGVSVNQTREQQETQDQDRNREHNP